MSKPSKFTMELGSVSVNKESASIGFSVARGSEGASLGRLDQILCKAQVHVHLEQTNAEEEQGAAMFGRTGLTLEGVADIGRLSVGPDDVTGRMSFNAQSLEIEDLAAFRGCTVEATVKRTGSAGDKAEAGAA